MKPYTTFASIRKSIKNTTEKAEGISILNIEKIAEYFEIDIYEFLKEDFYLHLLIKNDINGFYSFFTKCNLDKSKNINKPRGDAYINRERYEKQTGKIRFPAGNKMPIEIVGFESLNGKSVVYADTYGKSKHCKLFSERTYFNNKVRGSQPNVKEYCEYYHLDLNDIKEKYNNQPSVDHRVSLYDAFDKGWTIEQTNDWKNLQLLSKSDNSKKGKKSDKIEVFEKENVIIPLF